MTAYAHRAAGLALAIGMGVGLGLVCQHAQAQTSVALQGVLGSKALLIVDGAPPKAMAAGDTHKGVKLLTAAGEQAEVEINGKRQTLRVGESQASVGASNGAPRGSRIVMTASTNGHFLTGGTINGRAVQFMVDTGASAVSLGAPDAERLGISYKNGRAVRMSTANGVAQGWVIRLPSVRIGDVEVFDVEAIVGEQAMPYVLLGNSYLTRFQMKRENEQMVLERRY